MSVSGAALGGDDEGWVGSEGVRCVAGWIGHCGAVSCGGVCAWACPKAHVKHKLKLATLVLGGFDIIWIERDI